MRGFDMNTTGVGGVQQRLAAQQRAGVAQPLVALAQARQTRAGQGIETLAAGGAAIAHQPIGLAPLLGADGLAVRAASLRSDPAIQRGQDRILVRRARVQGQTKLLPLLGRELGRAGQKGFETDAL
jgi:hypothetical protein